MTGSETLTQQQHGSPRKARGEATAQPGLLIPYSDGHVPAPVVPGLPRTTIGRDPGSDVYLDDPLISRAHATIAFAEGNRIEVEDLGSHNGTFVNGARLTAPADVGPGDVIRCGSTLLLPLVDVAPYKGWPAAFVDESMVGGPELQQVLRKVSVLAPLDLPVLVAGESGTGKELVSTTLHARSQRAGPLVALNCAAIPEALFEAQLFGARKGAFTGAAESRPGLIREADGGTLFLDEIGEMPLPMQAKLLRAVETRQVLPVGASRPTAVDVRFVAATNRDLPAAVAQETFRADLYHRLRGAELQLPPLRARIADVVLLAQHFLAGQRDQIGARNVELSVSFVEALLLHRWPGNVRELQRVLREALVHAVSEGLEALAAECLGDGLLCAAPMDERALVCEALRRTGGNVVQAAADMGISRSKLYNVLREHGLSAKDFRRGL